jgi:hypothetical protein
LFWSRMLTTRTRQPDSTTAPTRPEPIAIVERSVRSRFRVHCSTIPTINRIVGAIRNSISEAAGTWSEKITCLSQCFAMPTRPVLWLSSLGLCLSISHVIFW